MWKRRILGFENNEHAQIGKQYLATRVYLIQSLISSIDYVYKLTQKAQRLSQHRER